MPACAQHHRLARIRPCASAVPFAWQPRRIGAGRLHRETFGSRAHWSASARARCARRPAASPGPGRSRCRLALSIGALPAGRGAECGIPPGWLKVGPAAPADNSRLVSWNTMRVVPTLRATIAAPESALILARLEPHGPTAMTADLGGQKIVGIFADADVTARSFDFVRAQESRHKDPLPGDPLIGRDRLATLRAALPIPSRLAFPVVLRTVEDAIASASQDGQLLLIDGAGKAAGFGVSRSRNDCGLGWRQRHQQR